MSTCDKETVDEIGEELASLRHCSWDYGGSGGGKRELEEEHGVARVRKIVWRKMFVSNEFISLSKSESVTHQPVRHAGNNWKKIVNIVGLY